MLGFKGFTPLYTSIFITLLNRFYMDLESEENTEKDEFFEECLNDPTLRDQMSILTRKYKNKTQVRQ